MNSNTCTVAPKYLDALAKKVETEMGLSFLGARRRDLGNAVRCMAESEGFPHADACASWLLGDVWNQEKADLCARHLTIGETYFFRESRAFDLVCDYARKKLTDNAGADTRLRIWSAGCCTGEEPYSIAMALKHAVPDVDPGRISIAGTDINNGYLDFARLGVYRQWSFRNTCSAIQNRNFSAESENQFRICNEIKSQVRFSVLNLALPIYPSVATNTQAMDIIFCRNVLMYFSPQQMRKVIERMRECLVEGGWLIVSPSEAFAEMFAGFSSVYYPDAIFFQKNSVSDTAIPRHGMACDGRTSVEPADRNLGPDDLIAVSSADRAPANAAHARADMLYAHTGNANNQNAVAGVHALAIGVDDGEAARHAEQAKVSESPTAELYHAKALIAMEAGDHRDALKSLKRAIYLKPDFILAHYLIGILHVEQNRHADAVRQLQITSELLAALDDDEVLPGSDGLPAAYLRESVRSYLQKGGL